ncbi:MAG: FHA domain-containing protein [Pyrinomonadaceae bacterium]
MIKCEACGTSSPDSAAFCDQCGTKLPPNDVHRTDLPNPQNNTVESPILSGADVATGGAAHEAGGAGSGTEPATAGGKTAGRARLVIDRGDAAGTEFVIDRDEATIGRWDADNGIFPDVDLDSFDQEAKVSRRHARVIRRDGGYFVEDLGSTNGTFINRGRRLLPGTPQPLADGDEIIVGKTFLRFKLNG